MQEDTFRPKLSIPTPRELYAYLNKHVIGQEEAKKYLSVAIYNHYKRFMCNKFHLTEGTSADKSFDNVKLDKSNVLLLGPTGSGKTYMIKMLVNLLNLPMYIADATKVTESGYVGDDVENVVLGVLRAADYDVDSAEHGVVIIDEFDKLSRKGENTSITRDVSGEGVQQSLLKIVEGSTVSVPPNGGRKHPQQECIDVDTSNMLFIGLGAFDGIEKIIDKRRNTKTIGYCSKEQYEKSKTENTLDYITSDDLKSFGIIPELIGRFPVVTHTSALTENDMVRILTEPENSIVKQYQKLFWIDGVNLSFTDDAIRKIAKSAVDNKTGARGLRGIMEKLLNDIMFEYGGNAELKDLIIDETYVTDFLEEQKKVA